MSKRPVLYYAIVRNGWSAIHGFKIMRVTTEKNAIIHGSYLERMSAFNETPIFGGSTHCRSYDMKAKCETIEQAQVLINAVKKIYEDYKPKFKALKDAEKKLERDRRDSIDALIHY